MREMAGVSTLREHRIEHCDKFASKCANSDRFGHWFPLKRNTERQTKRQEEYQEEVASCVHVIDYLTRQFFYMRRHLNGKIGCKYGSRNEEYRE